jgi:heme oxygenase
MDEALQMGVSDPPADPPAGFATQLNRRTWALHRRAERTGVVSALLRGTATRRGYALYLRNLAPSYQELERGLEQHRAQPLVAVLAQPALYRAGAIADDLERLAEPDLPLLPAGERYRAEIRAAADRAPERLVGHAYVRYFGDLSGGQTLKRVLGRTLGLGPAELQLYAFPEIADQGRFKQHLKEALDQAAERVVDLEPVLEAAAAGFAATIAVSEAVRACELAAPLA